MFRWALNYSINNSNNVGLPTSFVPTRSLEVPFIWVRTSAVARRVACRPRPDEVLRIGTKLVGNPTLLLSIKNLPYSALKTLSLVSISVMSPQQSLQEIFRTADCVCFDVDSTVIQDEGIDELANFCGKGDEVKRLTAEAMGGNMTFQEALKKRLDIIRPTVSQIRSFIDSIPIRLTPGIKELVRELHQRGVQVYLVSGGFRSLIEPVAELLGVPKSNIFANRLKFYFNGEYAGFDENEPTSRSGGKALAIRRLKEQHSYQRVVMIGDGATDAEASPPADGFIGFGGNVVREEVKKRAHWYVTDFQELIATLKVQTK